MGSNISFVRFLTNKFRIIKRQLIPPILAGSIRCYHQRRSLLFLGEKNIDRRNSTHASENILSLFSQQQQRQSGWTYLAFLRIYSRQLSRLETAATALPSSVLDDGYKVTKKLLYICLPWLLLRWLQARPSLPTPFTAPAAPSRLSRTIWPWLCCFCSCMTIFPPLSKPQNVRLFLLLIK